MMEGRAYHTASLYKNKIYIYGGYDLNRGPMNDFIAVNISKEDK